jgi:hypothetical protein
VEVKIANQRVPDLTASNPTDVGLLEAFFAKLQAAQDDFKIIRDRKQEFRYSRCVLGSCLQEQHNCC